MFYIFFHRIFVITIILTLVSTSFTSEITDLSKGRFYQMVKEENKNESFHEYLSTQLKPYEKHMEFFDYYDTIHNLEQKRIPAPFEKYDYKAYEYKLIKYCEHEYVSVGRFNRDNAVIVFKDAISSLKNCIDDILTDNNDENLRDKMIEVLSWLPTNDFKNDDSGNVDDEKENSNYFDCIVEDNEKNNVTSEKLIKQLLIKMSEIISPDHKKFESCMQLFQKKYASFPNKSHHKRNKPLSISLGSLYLAQAIIYHQNLSLDDIDMSKLYTNFRGFKEVEITNADRRYCHENIKKMDLVTYTATKLNYMILPTLLEHESRAFYIKRINKIIDYLSDIDKGNIQYYKNIKNYTENITNENFERMIKRRAIRDENYISYAMRMNIRGYLPLPSNLWIEEIANLYKREIQIITEQELKEDIDDL